MSKIVCPRGVAFSGISAHLGAWDDLRPAWSAAEQCAPWRRRLAIIVGIFYASAVLDADGNDKAEVPVLVQYRRCVGCEANYNLIRSDPFSTLSMVAGLKTCKVAFEPDQDCRQMALRQ